MKDFFQIEITLSEPGIEWPEKVEKLLCEIENFYAVDFSTYLGGTRKEAVFKKIKNRSLFLKNRLKTKSRYFSIHGEVGNKSQFAMIGSHTFPSKQSPTVIILTNLYPTEPKTWLIHNPEKTMLYLAEKNCCPSMLVNGNEFTSYLNGFQTVCDHGEKNYIQLLRQYPSQLEEKLPLMWDWNYNRRDSFYPAHIGWLNYWSAAICVALDFPNCASGESWLSWCYQTPDGGWIVKLAPEPPQLPDEGYLSRLISAYNCLPKIGLRLTDAEAKLVTRKIVNPPNYSNIHNPECTLGY